MTAKQTERPTEYDENGAYCWLYHQWKPWQARETENEGWQPKSKELYRSCYKCPEFQVKSS